MNGSFWMVRCAATTVLITRRMRPWRGSGMAEIITSSSSSALVSMNEPTNFSTSWSPVDTPAAEATYQPAGVSCIPPRACTCAIAAYRSSELGAYGSNASSTAGDGRSGGPRVQGSRLAEPPEGGVGGSDRGTERGARGLRGPRHRWRHRHRARVRGAARGRRCGGHDLRPHRVAPGGVGGRDRGAGWATAGACSTWSPTSPTRTRCAWRWSSRHRPDGRRSTAAWPTRAAAAAWHRPTCIDTAGVPARAAPQRARHDALRQAHDPAPRRGRAAARSWACRRSPGTTPTSSSAPTPSRRPASRR